jgi:choline dehydrogenase-like flavoprotein
VFLDEATGRAGGVRVIDANTREVMDFKAKVVVLGAGCLDSTRILLNSKSARHPQGMGNSSGLLGCHLSEHAMGPARQRVHPAAHRDGSHARRRARGHAPTCPRFRNVKDKHPDFIRGYHFQGGGGGPYEYPGMAHDLPGFGKAFKSSGPQVLPGPHQPGRLRRGLPRKENRVSLDAEVKTPGASRPPLRLHRSATTRRRWRRTWGTPSRRCCARRGRRTSRSDRRAAAPGWSIHEIGTARMGDDPKTSVTDRWCRLHDVSNVYMADAAPFVSGGHAEHDVVHPGHVLADDGLPQGADADGQRLASASLIDNRT